MVLLTGGVIEIKNKLIYMKIVESVRRSEEMEEKQVREDLEYIFKKRYEIRRGRWGLYFYDNLLRKDLDLNEVIIKLRKLQIYEKEVGDNEN